MNQLLMCYIEPKNGLLTGNETPLDILLGGRVNNDIQHMILGFLDEEPGFPEALGETSYIELYDSYMKPQVFPVDQDELWCFLDNDYDDDFSIESR